MKLFFIFALIPCAALAGEFWVSPTPSQPLPSIHTAYALGDQNNPYDGSDSTRFDTVMSIMPTRSLIHLMVGTFQTRGPLAWGPKTGQTIVGAGMYLTTVQFLSNAVASGSLLNQAVIGIQSPYRQTNVTVCDMTIDCNYQNGTATTLNGISLHGSDNAIRRVRLINCGSFTVSPTNYAEAWGLIISGFPFSDATGNEISGCVITGYKCNYGNNLSALGLLENNSGSITGNRVIQTGSNYVFGAYPGSHDSIMAGNLFACVIGSHYDSGNGVTNDIITSNLFIGCANAIDWLGGHFCDTIIANNIVSLTNDGTGRFSTQAFKLDYPPPSSYSNILITNNLVK